MSTGHKGFKRDGIAKETWGDLYDAIPKSVFALAAWHLANLASGYLDAPGAAENRFATEVYALSFQHIDEAQSKRVLKALADAGFAPEQDNEGLS